MNQCQLMGRLVRDPELKYTPQGTAVTSFTLAVDRRFNRDKADYINIIAWRQTAEFVAKHFAKGQRVAIVGSIQTRSWEAYRHDPGKITTAANTRPSKSSPILSILRTPKRKAPPEATPKAP